MRTIPQDTRYAVDGRFLCVTSQHWLVLQEYPEEIDMAQLQHNHDNNPEAVRLMTLQLLSDLLSKNVQGAIASIKAFYTKHIHPDSVSAVIMHVDGIYLFLVCNLLRTKNR
jgi:hypothetical protein